MRRNGNVLVVVAALIVAVVSLGIAFAAFSTTLTINGSATVNSSSWKIHYATSATGSDPGSTGTSITPTKGGSATGSGTLKTDLFTWSGTFTKPGDSLTYTFYIKNAGDYAAKITSITTPSVTCKVGTTAETDVCSKISYKVYKNTTGTTNLAKDETLAAGASIAVRVVATLGTNFATDGSDLPTANVTVNPVSISIVWGQA